ncbi:MAG TPA: hypothetical protein VFW28_06390 [Micropepsaceae bacterium]|nr:hypothetical protein [Micropepsaceae bacterium]
MSDRELSPGERFADLTLVEETLQRAVREALLRHKKLGNRIAVWRDGQVVELTPEQIPVDEE